ncbi:MAG: DUF3098 domain-containing protein [Saprospiraceae bacterium]|nr:DUF3098 domain-containing protein [Saprospiraceae bacterium]
MGESKSKQTQKKEQDSSKPKTSATTPNQSINVGEVTYGMKQYRYVFIGIGLLVIGFFLMSGGNMPSPDVWDENIIYGFRRTVAAPIFLLAGLIVQIWAIFKI